VLDQLRTVDAERLTKRLGRLRPDALESILELLREMFARYSSFREIAGRSCLPTSDRRTKRLRNTHLRISKAQHK